MNRNARLSIGAALGLFLLVFFLYLVRSVAVPFLLALILAYFLDPAVDLLERRRIPRTPAIGLVFAGFLLLTGGLAAFLVPAVRGEVHLIQKALPGYAENLYNLVPQKILQWLDISGGADLQGLLNKALDGAKNLSFDVVNQVAIFLSRAFSTTFSLLLAVLGYFIIPVYLFYLLRDFDRLKGAFMDLVPPWRRPAILSLRREIDQVLGGFIRGQLSVCLALAVLYSVGLALIGIDLALVIGIISGLAFIIPYLGTILGIIAGVTMAAIKFHDMLHPLLVLGWFALAQALEGTILTPRLVGNRLGLHPVLTILAVLIGGELFGFFGLLLAVPVAATGKVLAGRLIRRYRESALYSQTGDRVCHAEDS
jgi:predicted PurR-regulated permease PerM